MNMRSGAHQIVRFIDFESTELHITLTKRVLALALRIENPTVERALLPGYEDPRAHGRLSELSHEK
jgi:hypothetical protein